MAERPGGVDALVSRALHDGASTGAAPDVVAARAVFLGELARRRRRRARAAGGAALAVAVAAGAFGLGGALGSTRPVTSAGSAAPAQVPPVPRPGRCERGGAPGTFACGAVEAPAGAPRAPARSVPETSPSAAGRQSHRPEVASPSVRVAPGRTLWAHLPAEAFAWGSPRLGASAPSGGAGGPVVRVRGEPGGLVRIAAAHAGTAVVVVSAGPGYAPTCAGGTCSRPTWKLSVTVTHAR